MKEKSLSIRKEIDKTFSDLINKKSYFPSDLEDELFHRTFDTLLEIANSELATPLGEENNNTL